MRIGYRIGTTGAVLALGMAIAPVMGAPAAPPSTPSSAMGLQIGRIAAPDQKDALPLYPGTAPGSQKETISEIWDRMPDGEVIVRDVVRPTLTPFLPDPAKATGAAVIVIPGGGFQFASMSNEGWPVAKWLQAHGIAAFVLKYRLNDTAADEAAFGKEMMARFTAAAIPGASRAIGEPRATMDALRALRIVRERAASWHVDPARIGVIGFSAGAMTALETVRAPDAAVRPAFFGYVYGPMTSIAVPDQAPPMFAALAVDDPLFGKDGYGIVEAWHQAKRPVELHVYEHGSHGFGMGRPGTTSTGLMDEFHLWMQARKLVGATVPHPGGSGQ